jgi:cobalt-zinc-cadmium resistance protein CzcA
MARKRRTDGARRRRITVQCNVRGRDVASFVAEAKDRISEQVVLPEEYTIE